MTMIEDFFFGKSIPAIKQAQPKLVQYAPLIGYVPDPAPQSIVIKPSSTTVEIPVKTSSEVVAAAVSFLKQS